MRTFTGLAVVPLICSCASIPTKPAGDVVSLQQDLSKVQFAIRKTKVLIAKARGRDYLPDLHMRLAELYVEEAKYHYHTAISEGQDPKRGVDSVPVRVLKSMAVGEYRRLLAQFPDYRQADKARFFLAHELRELGDFKQMLHAYMDLAQKHPKSPYRSEGLLTVGDYYFNKGDLDRAERHYVMILAGPESKAHALARFKLAWCRINRADFKGALKLLEGSVLSARRWLEVHGNDAIGRIDLRREALIDSAYPYTEVHRPEGALKYFKERADSKQTYLAALAKLGNRYYVKSNWPATALIYRELLALSGDSGDALEYAHRLYEAISNGEVGESADRDVEAIVRVIRRRYHSHELSTERRARIKSEFERYARFISIKLHDLANSRKEERLYRAAVRAYGSYLSFFGDGRHADAVRANLADVFFAAKRYLEAGIHFELASMTRQGEEQRKMIWAAAAAFSEFIKAKRHASRLRLARAQSGLRRVGRRYIKLFPKDPRVLKIKFNIARTFYDTGDFDQAIRYFRALILQYPGTPEAQVAAHLSLDSYRLLDDDEGLITAGKGFLALAKLGKAEFKKEVAQIVDTAKDRVLGKYTLTKRLKELIGTDLECGALINQYKSARSSGDTFKLLRTGDELKARCPTAAQLPAALAEMGKLASESLLFARAAAYLEDAALRRNDKHAAKLYEAACLLRIGLGQPRAAERSLVALYHLGGRPHESAADLTLKVARLHLSQGHLAAANNLLLRALAAGVGTPDVAALLGYTLLRKGDLTAAKRHLVRASGGSAEAARIARYYLGDLALRSFRETVGPAKLSELARVLKHKLGAAAQVRAAFTGVAESGDGTWAVAALGRLAAANREMAAALRAIPLPGGLSPAEARQVRSAIDGQARPLDREARDAIKQCAVVARKLRVLSEAATACLAGRVYRGDPLKTRPVAGPTAARAEQLTRRLANRRSDIKQTIRLGSQYLRSKQPYLARLALNQGRGAKETGELLVLLGVAAARLGEYQSALALFDAALSKAPNNRFAQANRAWLLERFGYQRKSPRPRAARPDVRLLP